MTFRDAMAVGVALNARGAIEVILASVALECGLIEQRVFVALVVMALVTSMFSGPGLRAITRGSPADPGCGGFRKRFFP